MQFGTVATIDYHTAGEPFRIVADPPVALSGQTVAQRRVEALADVDAQLLRRLLCHEPRGHADMYGGFIVPPDDDAAHLGVLFWHKDGFSTACGHGTMALGVWAVHTGLVAAPSDGTVDVVIDVPSGRVTARVHVEDGRCAAVEFVSVPSFVLAESIPVPTSRGTVAVEVSFGGAIYAQLPAAELGLAVTPQDLPDLIAAGREIKAALAGTEHALHPSDDRLSGVYGTIFYDAVEDNPESIRQRNVTVFADGQVDRSPCGSGTAARVATLAAQGLVGPDRHLIHDSIVGSTFRASISGRITVEGRDSVLPVIVGNAFRTGEHRFHVDPDDDLIPGFVLR